MSDIPFDIKEGFYDKKPETQMVTIKDEDYCPYCHAKTIELYDSKNNPHSYGYLLKCFHNDKRKMIGKFNRMVLAYFRCKICKKKFTIDWTSGYPKPLLVKTKFD